MESPGSSLRGDMVPGSQAIPAERKIYERIKGRLFYRLLLGAMILAGIWYLLAGQGRRSLESELMGLITSEAPITSNIPDTQSPTFEKTPTASSTPAAAITHRPTMTQPVESLPSPTRTPLINRASATPTIIHRETVETAEPGCKEALTITLKDVGTNICVQGTVANIIYKTTNTMVIFSVARDSLYWVTYDLVWTEGEIGKCYQIDGTINQILNNPVLVFNYHNMPRECP